MDPDLFWCPYCGLEMADPAKLIDHSETCKRTNERTMKKLQKEENARSSLQAAAAAMPPAPVAASASNVPPPRPMGNPPAVSPSHSGGSGLNESNLRNPELGRTVKMVHSSPSLREVFLSPVQSKGKDSRSLSFPINSVDSLSGRESNDQIVRAPGYIPPAAVSFLHQPPRSIRTKEEANADNNAHLGASLRAAATAASATLASGSARGAESEQESGPPPRLAALSNRSSSPFRSWSPKRPYRRRVKVLIDEGHRNIPPPHAVVAPGSSSPESVAVSADLQARSSAERQKDTKRPRSRSPSHPLRPSQVDIPQEFECAITYELMRDPVVDKDGNTFEREAIEKWLRENKKSPITRRQMTVKDLVPNRALQNAIQTFAEKNGLMEKLKQPPAKGKEIAPRPNTLAVRGRGKGRGRGSPSQ